MKKLIIATGTLGGGGAERAFLNIANEMVNKNVEIHVLVTGSRPAISYPIDERIVIEKIQSKKKNKILKVIDKFFQFRKYFKNNKGSSVISFFPDVSAYCTLASFGIDIKNIVSERNDPNIIPRKGYMKAIRNFAFRMANSCVFQTEDARDYFPEKVRKKGIIISNPIAVDKLPNPKPLNIRRKVIILVGRIVPQKNFIMMLKAWEKIKDEFNDFAVHIYGDKTYRDGIFTEELEDYIKSHGLENSVFLKGFTTEIYEKMNDASIYVSTSDFEGMSNTMLEAMAIGTPTIATDCPIGGAKTIIENEVNGILIKVGDVDELANVLRDTLNDYHKREKLSYNGLKIRNTLNVSSICEQWYRLL